jgi:hypothetical protein
MPQAHHGLHSTEMHDGQDRRSRTVRRQARAHDHGPWQSGALAVLTDEDPGKLSNKERLIARW